MDFTPVIARLKQKKLAACRYEMEGHRKFRDCVTVCRNGKLLFERFNYGEAASLTFSMWAKGLNADGTIGWDYDSTKDKGRDEAPRLLTSVQNNAEELIFDEGRYKWLPARDLRSMPSAGLGGFTMFFLRIFG